LQRQFENKVCLILRLNVEKGYFTLFSARGDTVMATQIQMRLDILKARLLHEGYNRF
jgi:hypothetical protein